MDKQSVPVTYVALGDSTGVGVGSGTGASGYVARLFERIERERPGSRLVNLCVSGATTADVLRSQMPRFERERPDLVTVGIGVNDVQRLSLEEYDANLEEIITRVRAVTDAPLVLTNIPDISCAPGVPAFMREDARARIRLFNRAIEDAAARHRLRVVDVYTPSAELLPARPEFFCADGFHPSDAGYEFWADAMWPAVEESLNGRR
ncbi:MAG TPA: SGNH/GDSL hydrolase family protein [Pyrinomonadaceae bacterium]|nr:SGNH/GDSL hydrolase family protein [Pyrinomonadaceae bacterium]